MNRESSVRKQYPDRGASLVEYALLIALIVVVISAISSTLTDNKRPTLEQPTNPAATTSLVR